MNFYRGQKAPDSPRNQRRGISRDREGRVGRCARRSARTRALARSNGGFRSRSLEKHSEKFNGAINSRDPILAPALIFLSLA